MTSIDLRRMSLRPGEVRREEIDVQLEPFVIGGQRYEPDPAVVPARLVASEASGGTMFALELRARLAGPCMRCLEQAEVEVLASAREFHDPAGEEGLRSEYVVEDRLEVGRWAHDLIGGGLPEQILCRPDCAGLCPACGKNLNLHPHSHEERGLDPRWAALEQLRDET